MQVRINSVRASANPTYHPLVAWVPELRRAFVSLDHTLSRISHLGNLLCFRLDKSLVALVALPSLVPSPSFTWRSAFVFLFIKYRLER